MTADKMFEICSNKRRPKREKRYRILKKRKNIRQQLKLLKKREYQKLRTMVPCIAGKPHVSKVTVIEEAAKYIDQLHAAVVMKLRARQIPAEVLSSPTRAGCSCRITARSVCRPDVRRIRSRRRTQLRTDVYHRWRHAPLIGPRCSASKPLKTNHEKLLEFFKATCSPVAKRTQIADEIFRLVRSSTEARRRRRQLEDSNETRIRTDRLHSAELSNYLPLAYQGQQKLA